MTGTSRDTAVGDAAGPLTLSRLLADPALGLTALDRADTDVVVRGAHSIEIADAARWLRPGTLMLTTGLRFAGGVPDGDRRWDELVAALAVARVAGLLFGVGMVFDDVPDGLRRAATAHRLPLVAVAPEVPFARIEEAVTRGVLASETYLLRRTVWLQDDLLGAMVSTDPVDTLMARSAALARGAAALFDAQGRTVAATGAAPFRLIADEVLAATDDRPIAVGRWHLVHRALRIGPADYRLVIASRDARLLADLGDDLVRTAGRVLAAANSVRVLTADQERAEAGRVLATLLAGIPASRVRQTWERLRAFGFRPGEPLRMVRWEAPTPPRLGANRTLAGDDHDPPRLLLLPDADPAGTGTTATALLADDPAGTRWMEVAAGTGTLGASGPFTELTACPAQAEEAGTAHRLARRRAGRGAPVLLDQLDYATWLAATREDDPRAADRFEQHFGSLRRESELVATVASYLAHQQDVGATARALYVHPNTVRYRLRKAEALLGAPMAATSTVANLYLAFRDEIDAAAPLDLGST